MRSEIIIKSANVFDFKNGIKGDKKDILISNGKITGKLKEENTAIRIDGSKHIAFPGGIDLRGHFFAQEVNYIRAKALNEKNLVPIPGIRAVQEQYINHGFLFSCEADVPVTQSKLTLFNMKSAPLIDKAMIMDFGSNWMFLPELQEGEKIKRVATILSKLMMDLKGYGISINCPYHPQFWNLNKKIPENPQETPMLRLNISDIFKTLVSAVEMNQFRAVSFITPYDIENFSQEDNHLMLLKEIIEQNFPDKSNNRSNRVHLSNSNQYFSEKIDDLIDFYINHNEFELDVSPVILGKDRPLITRDRNLANKVSKESGIPVTTVDLEFDTEYYITTRNLRDENIYNLQLWSRWLEIILKLKEKGNLKRISIASNAPYNMSITDYPKVFEWLLNNESRIRYLSEFPSNLTENLKIMDITTSLDFFDLCGLISTNPAKALGINEYKGHLGAGADADITLFKFDLNNSSINTSKFGEEISIAFSDSSIVIKNGEIIKKQGVIQSESENTPHGRIFWNQGIYDEELMKKVITSKESFYKKHFSLYLQNLKNKSTDNMENLKSD